MNRTTLLVAGSLAVLLSVAALGISAAVDTPRTLMSRGDYRDARKVIDLGSRKALARCRDLDGTAKEVCRAEARADEKIRKADLDARYYGTVAAAEDANRARAGARLELARVRCEVSPAIDRDQCLRDARDDKSMGAARLAAT
jgi:hypothetical protein